MAKFYFLVSFLALLLTASVDAQTTSSTTGTVMPTGTGTDTPTVSSTDSGTSTSTPTTTDPGTTMSASASTTTQAATALPCCINGGQYDFLSAKCLCNSGYSGPLCCDLGTATSTSTTTTTVPSSTSTSTSTTVPGTTTTVPSSNNGTTIIPTSTTTTTQSQTTISTDTQVPVPTSTLDSQTPPPTTASDPLFGTFNVDLSQSTIATGALYASVAVPALACPSSSQGVCCGFDVCDTTTGLCTCPIGRSGSDCCTVNPTATTATPSTPTVQTTVQIVDDAAAVNGFTVLPLVASVGSLSAGATPNLAPVTERRVSLVTSALEEFNIDTGVVVSKQKMDESVASKSLSTVTYTLRNGARVELTYKFYNETNTVRFGNRSTVLKSSVGFVQSNMTVTNWPFASQLNRLRFTYVIQTGLELYGVAEIQDDAQKIYRLFRWRSTTDTAVLMGIFTFVIADGSTLPLSMTYKVQSGDIRVTMLLPSFTKQLVVDPDLSVLLGDQDLPSGKKKKSKMPIIVGATVGGVILLVLIIGGALFLYSRKHKQSVLFHSDKDSL